MDFIACMRLQVWVTTKRFRLCLRERNKLTPSLFMLFPRIDLFNLRLVPVLVSKCKLD